MRHLFFSLYKILLLPHFILYTFCEEKSIINHDLKRWAKAKNIKGNNTYLLFHFLTFSPDFRTIFYFRTKNIFTHVLNLYCRKQKGFIIDVRTHLGGGIITGHPYATILNAKSIGENFYVNHLVTIGEIDGKRPIIGDNVSIYTGAIVIGDIKIGNNSKIGAGAVVVKNVPENSVVVGNPGRVIKQNGVKISK